MLSQGAFLNDQTSKIRSLLELWTKLTKIVRFDLIVFVIPSSLRGGCEVGAP